VRNNTEKSNGITVDILPLYRRIDELARKKERVIVAIDGNSAAGKSYLATAIKAARSCNVFTMDDFFLRPSQRTPDRLDEPGGNIDYERFEEELIEPLRSGKQFSYRPYNCRTGNFSAPVLVDPSPLNVIEGVYSLHPRYEDVYDIKVFMHLDETEQRHRLMERNAKLYERFIQEWIPMENKYFEHFKISEKCDYVFTKGE